MISKGLDFDHVAIVGILQADSIFYYPEFRSNERAYQLITQVAGRAGRKNKQGKVYLQAYNLNHDVIRYIIHYDYEGLAEKELNDRNEAQYPPMIKLIEITVKHKKPEMVDLACLKLSTLLQEKFGTRISNPMLPGISRLRNLYLRSIIIKSERNTTILSEIKQSIKDLIPEVMKFTGLSSTRFSVDVDPE
ncbi:MAG: primosomal protein N', partial [Saprospiraceae bacterium]|nr:primosomal protein N' [Saprospiraceae bacterium]